MNIGKLAKVLFFGTFFVILSPFLLFGAENSTGSASARASARAAARRREEEDFAQRLLWRHQNQNR